MIRQLTGLKEHLVIAHLICVELNLTRLGMSRSREEALNTLVEEDSMRR
ncbi:MAG: hypothetical protein IPP46_04890 [Bacteroidetes bacterium]|nr:hypothetical protein [Bacteroidota bacterium]